MHLVMNVLAVAPRAPQFVASYGSSSSDPVMPLAVEPIEAWESSSSCEAWESSPSCDMIVQKAVFETVGQVRYRAQEKKSPRHTVCLQRRHRRSEPRRNSRERESIIGNSENCN